MKRLKEFINEIVGIALILFTLFGSFFLLLILGLLIFPPNESNSIEIPYGYGIFCLIISIVSTGTVANIIMRKGEEIRKEKQREIAEIENRKKEEELRIEREKALKERKEKERIAREKEERQREEIEKRKEQEAKRQREAEEKRKKREKWQENLRKHNEWKAEKEKADGLIKTANQCADIINKTTNVYDFAGSYIALLETLRQLVEICERGIVPFTTSPQNDIDKITENTESLITEFIDRTVGEISVENGSRYKQVKTMKDFLNKLEEHPDLAPLLTESHKQKLSNLRLECEEEIEQGNSVEKTDTMEGHQFEYWCADLLRKNGFINVEVTPGSGDHGVDVLAEKDGIRYAIQCKCYSNDLGNTPVQEVAAGKSMYDCHVGAVMTNRYFTVGAKELAESTNTLLWDRNKLQEMLETADTNQEE